MNAWIICIMTVEVSELIMLWLYEYVNNRDCDCVNAWIHSLMTVSAYEFIRLWLCEYVNNKDFDSDWICELHYERVNMWINSTVIMWLS
jgi:hypothetical protein